MPNDQSQFRHLLPLLAQFHQSRLPPTIIHKICNPFEHLLVLFTDRTIHRVVLARHLRSLHVAIVVVSLNAVVMLLLGRGGSCGGGVGCVLLGCNVRVLLGVVGRLLLVLLYPAGLARVLMLVRKHVLLPGEHDGCR